MEYQGFIFIIFTAHLFFDSNAIIFDGPSGMEMDFVKHHQVTKGHWADLQKMSSNYMSYLCGMVAELPKLNAKGLKGKLNVVVPQKALEKSKYRYSELLYKTDVLVCTLGYNTRPYTFYLTEALETDQVYMLMKKRKNRARIHQKVNLRALLNKDFFRDPTENYKTPITYAIKDY